MNIKFNEKTNTFYLHTKNSTYAMMVEKHGYLSHLYYGKKIVNQDLSYLLRYKEISFSPNPPGSIDREFSINLIPLEYPAFGCGDFRVFSISIFDENGYEGLNLKYKGHKILNEKPELKGLPSTFYNDEAKETLEISLYDETINVLVNLYYSVFYEKDAIARHVVITNMGQNIIKINKAHSMCLDFNHDEFDLMTFSGKHGKERMLNRNSINRGIFTLDSKRGASSHQFNPSIILASKDANENMGESYGIALVYSGSFSFDVEVSEANTTRVTAGINPCQFLWNLKQGEAFTTPEALFSYSNDGVGQISRNFHDLLRDNLIKRPLEYKLPPVLINSWEGCYFDFDSDKLIKIAEEASALNIELFVMDDGWFGKRNNDKTSLGDWYVNKGKITSGLYDLVEKIKSLGMKFGIWVEPEMVSPESELYKLHPDWAIHMKNREPSISRNQLVLDFSRDDVKEYITEEISNILNSADISYVKWDMNRHITDVGSSLLDKNSQGEVLHRHILGVYEVMDKITSRFKNVLFEGCSGGGGRFDAGMLYYMPQIWASDNMDPIDRLYIQYGTSFIYPPCSMGTHVATVPNHSNGRITDFKTRGDVSLFGAFGYELDVRKLSYDEKTLVKEQIDLFHNHRKLIFNGDYYRILNPFRDNASAWAVVSKDKHEAILCFVQILSEVSTLPKIIKIPGLIDDEIYEINKEYRISGASLKNAGLNLELCFGDFKSQMFYLKKI